MWYSKTVRTIQIIYMKTTPFLVATLAAVGVTSADIIWMTGELLTHFGIITQATYVIWRLGVLLSLVIGFIITVVSGMRYITNGYVQADHQLESGQLRQKCQAKKRNRIFKNKSK